MHQEPQDDSNRENDRSGLDNKGFASLPYVNQHALDSRYVVSRQLHDKGRRISGEIAGLFQGDTCQNNNTQTNEIHSRREPCAAVEEGDCHHGNDLHLCGTGQISCQHDGHAAVFFVLNGTGSHDSRNTAAGSDQHGDKGFSGQSEMTEQTIHDKCDPGHVAGVLQQTQEKEQDQHLRNKSKDGSDTADHAINQQSFQPGSRACRFQSRGCPAGDPGSKQHVIGPVCHDGTDGRYGNIVDQEHDPREDRKSRDPVRDHFVDLIGDGQLVFRLFFLNHPGHDPLNVIIPRIGNDRFRIVIQLFFAVLDMPLNMSHGLLVQIQFIDNQ